MSNPNLIRKQLSLLGELAIWQQVPELVKVRYKEAADVKRTLAKVIKYLPAEGDYGFVYWHPEKKIAWAVLSDSDTQQTHQRWHNALKAIRGVQSVRTEAEHGPHNDPEWIRIKESAALSWLNIPYQAAGALTGGPSPMSNALVSGLLGAGTGYAAGTLAENLLPAQYVERGKLRNNLAMLGGVGGAALHIPQAVTNSSLNQKATGKPEWLRSIMQGDQHQQMAPAETDWRNHYLGGQKQADWDGLRECCRLLPLPPELFMRSASRFTKFAMSAGSMGANNVSLKPVPVDAFNQAIWNDVHNGLQSSQSNPYGTRSIYSDNSDPLHTPPVNAAAATGLVSGIQQMYGNASLLSPQHFISGLANAGVDMATARIAGGVLGALGGLTPEAQRKLQTMGLWSGMIRGVTGSVLGLR